MKIKLLSALICLGAALLSGCTTLDGPRSPNDPFESYNRSMNTFNSKADQYVLKPVAKGYDAITPAPIKKGVSNFFSNLDDVLVIFNDLFQLKFKQLASDTGRVLINSTVGVFGLIDWASDIGLKKHNEDFGQTLGYWGVPSGPYLILPFYGPSTVRDAGGRVADNTYFDPINNQVESGWVFPNRNRETTTPLTIANVVQIRAGFLKAEKFVNQAALDPYVYIREAYLQRRENLVNDGKKPAGNSDFSKGTAVNDAKIGDETFNDEIFDDEAFDDEDIFED